MLTTRPGSSVGRAPPQIGVVPGSIPGQVTFGPQHIVPQEAEKTCAPVRTAGMICDITWRCFQPLFLKGLAPGCFSTYASQEAALSTVILQPVESFHVHPDTCLSA